MGLVFDQEIARVYEMWCRSDQGRAIDRSIEKMVSDLLKPRPGERVLDIGCGTGNHLLALSGLGLDVSGVDASPYMIRTARERLGFRYMLRQAKAENLPFEDNEFDYAVFINTLEFLDTPVPALKEAGRVAAKKVMVSVINSLSWNAAVKKIQGCLGHPLFRSARFYNLWELRYMLRTAYGDCPTSWGCARLSSSLLRDSRHSDRLCCHWTRYPFGILLGISAAMPHRVKTDDPALNLALEKARRSLVGVKSLGHLNGREGVVRNERGLSL